MVPFEILNWLSDRKSSDEGRRPNDWNVITEKMGEITSYPRNSDRKSNLVLNFLTYHPAQFSGFYNINKKEILFWIKKNRVKRPVLKKEKICGRAVVFSELLIREPSSISSRFRYIHLHTNNLGKGMNPFFLPRAMSKQQDKLGPIALVGSQSKWRKTIQTTLETVGPTSVYLANPMPPLLEYVRCLYNINGSKKMRPI